MRILFVGDVVGRPGRNAVAALLPKIKKERAIDFAIVNGENSAGGAGLTADIARELNANGADVVTNGNHVWDQRQFLNDIELLPFAIRPIVVEGYTDSVGSESANLKLSQDRADAVRNFLVSKGLPSDKLTAVGRGKSNPVAGNDTADGRANNRRVELVVAGGGANAVTNGK